MIPELLSPARDVETAKCAILAGADAVYIGAPKFGARKDAANSAEDIAQLCRFAHLYGCKVYVALNTILFDGEIESAARLCEALWDGGADAIIAQDLGLLEATDRRVKFHASTQCNIDSPQKAKFLENAGFAAVVLARETGLAQTAETAKTVSVPIECFAHGALCVSYSGQCYLSYAIGGRSGNRGECAQPCRMLYELADADGKRIAPPAYYLCLRDMNRIGRLSDMLDAGVSIFKIEGRLKDAAYVKNITAAYRAALDEQLKKRNLPRASFGESQIAFAPDPKKSFNRLFCTYHLDGVEKGCSSFRTPKARGEYIGTAKKTFDGGFVFPRAENIFSNGDGLFFDIGENKNGFGAAAGGVALKARGHGVRGGLRENRAENIPAPAGCRRKRAAQGACREARSGDSRAIRKGADRLRPPPAPKMRRPIPPAVRLRRPCKRIQQIRAQILRIARRRHNGQRARSRRRLGFNPADAHAPLHFKGAWNVQKIGQIGRQFQRAVPPEIRRRRIQNYLRLQKLPNADSGNLTVKKYNPIFSLFRNFVGNIFPFV